MYNQPYRTMGPSLALVLAIILLTLGCELGAYKPLAADEISAPDAWTLARQGEMTIVDIRTPREWRQTGVAPGVLRIDMHHPQGVDGFVDALLSELGGDRSAAIGLICRTGNRSSQVQEVLVRRGFSRVYNIPEGMVGSRAGPGWLKRDLPVEPCTRC